MGSLFIKATIVVLISFLQFNDLGAQAFDLPEDSISDEEFNLWIAEQIDLLESDIVRRNELINSISSELSLSRRGVAIEVLKRLALRSAVLVPSNVAYWYVMYLLAQFSNNFIDGEYSELALTAAFVSAIGQIAGYFVSGGSLLYMGGMLMTDAEMAYNLAEADRLRNLSEDRFQTPLGEENTSNFLKEYLSAIDRVELNLKRARELMALGPGGLDASRLIEFKAKLVKIIGYFNQAEKILKEGYAEAGRGLDRYKFNSYFYDMHSAQLDVAYAQTLKKIFAGRIRLLRILALQGSRYPHQLFPNAYASECAELLANEVSR